ncbi:neuropeptide Y receptor Y7 [Trichomycterus rosablanca]|uniref:neuropeptide Y receptor Y7 n=1 Tax=Trichomycterus rosablanca TaxID=2290929 RepID=UPI002F350A12
MNVLGLTGGYTQASMGPLDPVNATGDVTNGEGDSTGWQQEHMSNVSTDSHKPAFVDDITKHLSVQIALITAYSLIILLGLVGNALVIYMIIIYKNMRTVTNYFIANLALADLMVDTMCLPFTLVYTLIDEWKFGAVMCHMVPYAQALTVHVSILTLTVIALERYRCIVFHMNEHLSRFASFTIISLTWVFAAILAGPLAIFREYRYEEITYINLRIAVCSEKWPHGTNRDAIIYSFSMLVLQYVLPLGIISYAYMCIWVKLKNHVSPCNRNDHIMRRRKTTKMLVLMVVVFAVCWLPFHVFQLASDLDLVLKFKEYKLLYTLFHIVAMCSTFTNPLLYGWMNKNYRNGFLMFFRCQHKPDTIHPEGSFRTRSMRGVVVNGYNTRQPATAV